MTSYIGRRLLYMVFTMVAVSMVGFAIIAINPIVSTVGGLLPEIVSGTIITAIVLNLPTVGPLLSTALTAEDMQLSPPAFVMVLAILTVIGTFISDMLLLWIDPRIRFEQEQAV